MLRFLARSHLRVPTQKSYLDNGFKKRLVQLSTAQIKETEPSYKCETLKKSTESINNASIQSELLKIGLKDESLNVNTWWLRDNCRCEACFNHTTKQRSFLPHNQHSNATYSSINVDQSKSHIDVTWSDGHKSQYEIDWIKENIHGNKKKHGENQERFFWDANKIKQEDMGSVTFRELLENDSSVAEVARTMWRYGFALVNDVPVSIEGTEKAAKRIGVINNTLFGSMWWFTNDMKHKDTAYSNIFIGGHTDNTYFDSPSGLQAFHCLEHDGEGGETLLIDGFGAAEKLRRDDLHAFNVLAETKVRHEYREPKYNVSSVGTILQTDPKTQQLRMLRYNHYDRSPIDTIPQEDITDFYVSLAKLSALLEDESMMHWIKLKPGTLLLVDNWRVLHGRAAFTGKRTMCGFYLKSDEWQSNIRTLVHNQI